MLLAAIINALICFMQIAPVPLIFIAVLRPDLIPTLPSPTAFVVSTIGRISPAPSVLTVDATPADVFATVLPSSSPMVASYSERVATSLTDPVWVVSMVVAAVMMAFTVFAIGIIRHTHVPELSSQQNVHEEGVPVGLRLPSPPVATPETNDVVIPPAYARSAEMFDRVLDASMERMRLMGLSSSRPGRYDGVDNLAAALLMDELHPEQTEEEQEHVAEPEQNRNDVDIVAAAMDIPLPSPTAQELAYLQPVEFAQVSAKSKVTSKGRSISDSIWAHAIERPVVPFVQREVVDPEISVEEKEGLSQSPLAEEDIPRPTPSVETDSEQSRGDIEVVAAAMNIPLPNPTAQELAYLQPAELAQVSAKVTEDTTFPVSSTPVPPVPVAVVKSKVASEGRKISDSIWAHAVERPVVPYLQRAVVDPEISEVEEMEGLSQPPLAEEDIPRPAPLLKEEISHSSPLVRTRTRTRSPTWNGSISGPLVSAGTTRKFWEFEDRSAVPLVTSPIYLDLPPMLNPDARPFVPNPAFRNPPPTATDNNGQQNVEEIQQSQEIDLSPVEDSIENLPPPHYNQPEVYYETSGFASPIHSPMLNPNARPFVPTPACQNPLPTATHNNGQQNVEEAQETQTSPAEDLPPPHYNQSEVYHTNAGFLHPADYPQQHQAFYSPPPAYPSGPSMDSQPGFPLPTQPNPQSAPSIAHQPVVPPAHNQAAPRAQPIFPYRMTIRSGRRLQTYGPVYGGPSYSPPMTMEDLTRRSRKILQANEPFRACVPLLRKYNWSMAAVQQHLELAAQAAAPNVTEVAAET
ncbi:hypothetical protein OF83DRAFT_1168337 [Amylostereum chailletii]|nr:hypothetical protein OF83DRAFT_1168337 [Amylostereum chailletii]